MEGYGGIKLWKQYLSVIIFMIIGLTGLNFIISNNFFIHKILKFGLIKTAMVLSIFGLNIILLLIIGNSKKNQTFK